MCVSHSSIAYIQNWGRDLTDSLEFEKWSKIWSKIVKCFFNTSIRYQLKYLMLFQITLNSSEGVVNIGRYYIFAGFAQSWPCFRNVVHPSHFVLYNSPKGYLFLIHHTIQGLFSTNKNYLQIYFWLQTNDSQNLEEPHHPLTRSQGPDEYDAG